MQNPSSLSPETVYNDLDQLEQVDTARSASYRQKAQEILADMKVSLSWRQAIFDRLNQANHFLGLKAVGKNDDSY
jgi:Fe2+ or Zn2+ uptake regulation protein